MEKPVTKEDIIHLHDQIESLKEERVEDLGNLRKERKEDMDAIMALLKPIAETYASASKLGKWIMAAAVFVSVLLGIIISLWNIISEHLKQ